MWNCAEYHAAVLDAQVQCFGRRWDLVPSASPWWGRVCSCCCCSWAWAGVCSPVWVHLVGTKVCCSFFKVAITKVSEPSCHFWSAHHRCAPLGKEDVVPLGQGVKQAQRDVKPDFNGYFCVSICGDINAGGLQTSSLRSLLLHTWSRVAPCGKLMNRAMDVHLPSVRGEFKDVPCWCRCGMVGEEGNVQSRKTRSGVNSSSNICMRVKKTTWVYCHLIGRMCVACVHPLISDAVVPCWYQ